jgi:hypothetical protein
VVKKPSIFFDMCGEIGSTVQVCFEFLYKGSVISTEHFTNIPIVPYRAHRFYLIFKMLDGTKVGIAPDLLYCRLSM